MTLHQKTRTSEIWEIAGERAADAAPKLSYSGNPILATFTHPDEECDRIAQIERAASWQAVSGAPHLRFILRCWGLGHWVVCEGRPAWFASREAAEVVARRWIETGRGA